MFAASLSHQVRSVSILLGGSGIRRIVEQKKPDVAALLKPRTDLGVSRSMPDAVVRHGRSIFMTLPMNGRRPSQSQWMT